jgi:hypothetical protein
MISELGLRGVGVGMRRFVVRGSIVLSEPREALLRPEINEYPERFALEANFPQAGRRGPSPVKSVVVAAGAAAPVSVYPSPRDRSGGIPTVSDPTLQPSGAAAGGCCIEDGDTVRSSPSVAAGSYVSLVSHRIPRAFVLTHLEYWSENTLPSNVNAMQLKVFIADDSSIDAGGPVVSGVPLDTNEGGDYFEPFSVMATHYPNKIIPLPGKFIKFEFHNASAAALETHVSMSWKYIQ